MDPVNLIYYAVVCGGLAAFVPSNWKWVLKVALGLGTGAVSSALLPVVHQILGF